MRMARIRFLKTFTQGEKRGTVTPGYMDKVPDRIVKEMIDYQANETEVFGLPGGPCVVSEMEIDWIEVQEAIPA